MGIKYINHITINTGHCRKSYPNEVNKELYFILHNIFKDAHAQDGCNIMDGDYNVKITASSIGYLTTLFGYDNGERIPVITSACSKADKGFLWDLLFQNAAGSLPDIRPAMPKTPYIADRIEPSAALFFNDLNWTADFTRCIGWICLYPEEIR